MSSPISPPGNAHPQAAPPLYAPIKRRSFFLYAGATAGATALVLAGCNDDSDSGPNTVNVGTGDTGVLNYAYALEQLEAAFYTEVRKGSYYAGAVAFEKTVLDDLYYHEVIHREFFKAALAGNAIKTLEPDFSGIDFTVRLAAAGAAKLGVLDAAKAFEDLGVAAYNGAGKYLTAKDNLTLAGKIVSVEARHAALIRDFIANNTFVGPDVVDNANGLEISMEPAAVVAKANAFLKEGSKLDVSGIR
ncbi:ferritin-like domain-containing protein [Hymenobacter glacialis]|uniref:Tat (Twin-arginine translocation) pathway signal sequence containing protein n=1 Tax=Hymenobacter glacialis TaxID=1908236 RepID=A0A1G1T2L0_9BACT|nr:ferritin-like domain-containing protein [Hymenobacter glacialis]OGX85100.1 hypothetical protein BEN48_14940 [Hymenobacter glacialis]